jgi:hypothetical protein
MSEQQNKATKGTRKLSGKQTQEMWLQTTWRASIRNGWIIDDEWRGGNKDVKKNKVWQIKSQKRRIFLLLETCNKQLALNARARWGVATNRETVPNNDWKTWVQWRTCCCDHTAEMLHGIRHFRGPMLKWPSALLFLRKGVTVVQEEDGSRWAQSKRKEEQSKWPKIN